MAKIATLDVTGNDHFVLDDVLRALKQASMRFSCDREVVLTIVKSHGEALHTTLTKLKRNMHVVKTAAKSRGGPCGSLQRISTKRKGNT